jgi:hypothetical protein
VALCAWSGSAAAIDLTGILLVGLGLDGRPANVAWHTAADSAARPLGFTAQPPHVLHTNFPLSNDAAGAVNIPLLPGTHIGALLWQCAPEEFPPVLLLNLYFNGDNLTPGISALVSAARGLTNARENRAPTTFSLFLREVENRGGLFFDDGRLRVQLGTAFYMPSGGDTPQWRPTDFKNVDRVGVRELAPDGFLDAVMVVELSVGPSQRPPTPTRGGTLRERVRPLAPAPNVEPQVGPDRWVVPPSPTLPAVVPTPPGGAAAARGTRRTPSLDADESPTPLPETTPSAAATPSGSPGPQTTPTSRGSATPSIATPRGTPSLPPTRTKRPTRRARVTP